ncbi:MAG TPA: DUF502 domain-containing protein [Methyloceanibacter sp.]|nr:DUF502 domain-containing protein [Methyloceanibacter sp.]
MGRILRTFLAGLLALLPIALTLFVTAWIASLIASYAGPGSFLGSLIIALGRSLGLELSPSSTVAYLLGLAIILAAIFVLGLLVESGLRTFISYILSSVDWLIMRIPLVSTVYDLSKRFVAIVDRGSDNDSLKTMQPVWCFFGGEGGAAVLGLMPSPEPVVIGEHSYLGLLVPSAPVPFGGALIYVPSAWVKPADGGVERLMNVYVSMGVTPPLSMPPGASKAALAKPAEKRSRKPVPKPES